MGSVLSGELAGRVLTAPESTERYRFDQSLGSTAGYPAAVVLAAGRNDVVTTLAIAQHLRIPVVPRGAGSGLAGGANALDGAIVLDLAGMDRIIGIEPRARTAVVEPGVLNAALDLAARTHGLRYAPDPGSKEISTIGGNIATNAGGMCCAKYGVTRDHVLQVTAVLAGGQVIEVGRATRKDVAGLDLRSLLVGSEGTLGVIVEATMRLIPVPGRTSTAAVTFASPAAALDAVLAMTAAATPSTLEFLDRTTVRAVNRSTRMGLDEDAGATLVLQCDGPHAQADLEACADLARASGAWDVFVAHDEEDGTALMQARRMALPALEQLGSVILDDVCVPVHRLPEMQVRVEEVAAALQVTIGSFGHAADGNLHPTIVFDAADDRARGRARTAFDRIVEAALDLDGTVTGEHGIGGLKTAHLDRQVGSVERALMRGVKQAFDPFGILNPGRGY
ncbi:FAD-binding protein [Nocardioides carbamazepini]|nr:FAD-binding protein [Nocardioides carbamazepini]